MAVTNVEFVAVGGVKNLCVFMFFQVFSMHFHVFYGSRLNIRLGFVVSRVSPQKNAS